MGGDAVADYVSFDHDLKWSKMESGGGAGANQERDGKVAHFST